MRSLKRMPTKERFEILHKRMNTMPHYLKKEIWLDKQDRARYINNKMNKMKSLETLGNELEQELFISQKAQEEITVLKVDTQPRTQEEFGIDHVEGEMLSE